MSFYYENQGINTYLVYEIKPEDVIDSMSLGMISNNKIDGFAATLFTQMNTTKYIKYDVTAKLSMKQFFEGVVNRKSLVGVFRGIINALLAAEDYMIGSKSILLDTNYIFVDVSTCKTELICLPVVGIENQYDNIGSFFKSIMFSTQLDSSENCDYVAKIINYLNSASVFSLNEFKRILDEIGYSSNASVQSVPAAASVRPVQQSVKVETKPAQTAAAPVPTPQVQTIQTNAVSPQQNINPVQPQTIPAQPTQYQYPQAPPQTQGKEKTKKSKTKNHVEVPQQVQPAAPMNPDEKQISIFGLMMHYSKENAEKYKAQKAAKKAGQAVAPAQQPMNMPQQRPADKRTQKQAPAFNGGFAVPGQQSKPNTSFAVPGQQTPSGASFAIPGQQTPSGASFAIPGQQTPSGASFAVPGQQTPYRGAQQTQPKKNTAAPVQTAPAYSAPVSQGFQMNTQMVESSMNFGETTVLGGGADGETAVLSDLPLTPQGAAVKQPFIVRVRNNERIALDKPVYRIGKERSFVDYFIGDNSYISRVHASIAQKDGRYYLIDNNSRNHTYLNGEVITSSTEYEMKSGDTFKLANEEFEFKLF